jgi:hypothetical protein
MFLASFYVPAVAGEVKLSYIAGVQGTLTAVSASASGARQAKLSMTLKNSVGAEGTAVLKEESTGKKDMPANFGQRSFPWHEPFHIAKGDLVELTLKGGEEKAPVEGVTVVLTFA